MDQDDLILPPRPQAPLPSDCCGNGCVPCVLDIYQEELEMWEAECIRMKEGETSTVSKSEEEDENTSELCRLQKDRYAEFKIITITQETHNTIRVRLSLPKSRSLGLSVGQHIILRATSSDGSTVTRQYTPISPVQSKGYFEFVLKLYSKGIMSRIIHLWQVGDRIDIRGPVGNLVYTPNKHKRLLMLCAGTGIAPMCQVIHAILDNEQDETLIRLIYACKNYTEIIAHTELLEWRRYWNFSCVFVLSQEPANPGYNYRYGEEIVKGHIDEKFINAELNDHQNKTLVLICGTRSFDSTMLGLARKMEVPEDSIHKF